ncbi:hypothetical protein FACS18945_3390 [Bacteroidia bacterium]|nr:hypothetical protein FACS18945_3390 [Bacteroidia bacterium]
MKQSKTTVKELTSMYRAHARKCALPLALIIALSTAGHAMDRIYVAAGDTETFDTVNIQNQPKPDSYGGAIENYGTITIGNDSIFSGNIGGVPGGVAATLAGSIYNAPTGVLTIGNNTIFSNNTADGAANILNKGSISIGNSAQFIDNTSTASSGTGAGFLNQNGTVIIGDNALFQGNTSLYSGGGFYQEIQYITGLPNAVATIGNNARFIGNKSSGTGGVYNYNASWDGEASSYINIGKNASFTDNAAETKSGGAIGNWNGVITIDAGARFASNTAGKNGGAIINANYYHYAAMTAASTTIGSNATFINNTAVGFGGAICNGGIDCTGIDSSDDPDVDESGATVTIGNAATFTSNSAGSMGGAIYNGTGAILNFNGDVSFSGNSANGALNDIYNLGTLNFNNGGTINLDGGINGTGNIVFGQNTNLIATIRMTPTIVANSVTIGSGSTISNLVIGAGVSGDNLELLSANTVTGSFSYAGSNLVYNILQNSDGSFNISKRSNSEIASAVGANSNQAALLIGLLSGTSTNNNFNAVSDQIMSFVQSDDPAEIAQGLKAVAALGPVTSPQVQSVATGQTAQVFNAVGNRLSSGTGADSSASLYGQASGDLTKGRKAIWVQGLYNRSKFSGENGFKSDSWGIAAGLEANVSTSAKLGLGYAYTQTDITPYLIDTHVKSNTLLGYGEYKPTRWFLNGIISYTFGSYKDEKHILGSLVTTDHDVNTLAMQALTGYEIVNRIFAIVPQAGLRYLHVSQNAFIDSIGSETHGNTSDYLTGIGGIKLSADIFKSAKFILRPELYVGATYDLVTSDINAYMTMANGSVVNVSGSALDPVAYEAGAGITMVIDNRVDLNAGYIGRFRTYYTDHTGMLTLKYKF